MRRLTVLLLTLIFATTNHTSSQPITPEEDIIRSGVQGQMTQYHIKYGDHFSHPLKLRYRADCSAFDNDGNTQDQLRKQISCHDLDGQTLRINFQPSFTGIVEAKITAYSQENPDNRATIVARITISPGVTERECLQWRCDLYTGFFLGYEGTSVGELDSKGNPRFQYSAHSQPGNFLHYYGDVFQSGSGEISSAETDCLSAGDDICEIKSMITGRIGIITPFYQAPRTSKKNWFPNLKIHSAEGVVVGGSLSYSVNKIQDESNFIASYYGGIRMAENKARYFDIAYGRVERIRGGRIRVMGQLPVYQEKLFVGIEFNVAADREARRAGQASADTIKIYAMTRVDFGKIFTSFTGD